MAEGQTNGVCPPRESGGENGLTPIYRRIHCATTPHTIEDQNKLDQIAVDHFLDTLTEVALAIARRRNN